MGKKCILNGPSKVDKNFIKIPHKYRYDYTKYTIMTYKISFNIKLLREKFLSIVIEFFD